jgi:hypothetical protein
MRGTCEEIKNVELRMKNSGARRQKAEGGAAKAKGFNF